MKHNLCFLILLAATMPAFAIWPFKTTKPVKDKDTIHIYNPKLPTENVKTRERPDESDKIDAAHLEKLAKAGNDNAQLAIGKCYFDGVGGVKQNYKKAVKYFEMACENNNASAFFNLGICYDGGYGVKQDINKAIEYYNRAADMDVPEAMTKMAVIAEQKGDYTTALKNLRKLAILGNPVCMRKVAIFLMNGLGTPVNDTEIIDMLTAAAQKGDRRAQVHLADCYQRGQGVEVNYDEMFNWLMLAAQDSDPEAQTKLAYCYQKGYGTVKNTDVAFNWYQLAANADYAPALVSLGDCYRDGSGTAMNPAKAVECYKAAAAKGDSIGQFRLGSAFLTGYVVRQNPEEAFKYISASANQDFPPAVCQLGFLNEKGMGTPQNPLTAFHCYQKAAAMKEPQAMLNLGLCYLNGIGTVTDRNEARKWLAEAAKNGSKEALQQLEKNFAQNQ
ncbi:MAG: sel1 repeat family protein [Lentisphaeria bacterium]|nr:sel1 repeat family protein [Victivallales bacterium]MCR4572751.1 sel1 repeat family protein [Lentisphaeria bacterium]